MMRYAPLAVERLGAAVFGFPPYAAKPMRRERVSRRGPSGAGERVARALTQERPEHYLASPFTAENPQRADAGQGSGPRSLPAPDASPAMGRLPQRPDLRHTAQPVKDQSNNTPLRPGRGLGAPSHQRVRQPTPALPGASVPVLHAQCLRPTSTEWQDRPP